MVDKPGITTLEQLAECRRVQAETKRIFSIMYSERLENRATVRAGDLVKAGAIGRVVQTIGMGPHRMNIPTRDLDLTGYSADTPRSLEESPRVVDLWFSPDAAGYEIENRSATRLVDGSAAWRTATNGDTWLVEEILSYRGRAIVTGPADLRARIAQRAKELRELVARVPVS